VSDLHKLGRVVFANQISDVRVLLLVQPFVVPAAVKVLSKLSDRVVAAAHFGARPLSDISSISYQRKACPTSQSLMLSARSA
jgi:hypothetical protein